MKIFRFALTIYIVALSGFQVQSAEDRDGVCAYSTELVTAAKPEEVTALSLFPEDSREIGIEEVRRLEEDALRAIENALPKNGEEEKQSVRSWFDTIRSHQRDGRHLTVMEHTALTFILREGIFDEDPDPSLLPEIRAALVQSWRDLAKTDMKPDSANLTERLPTRVLKNASRDEQLFHQAIFHDGPLGFLGSMKVMLTDYIPKPQDVIYGLMLGAALFSHTGSRVLAGILEGYAINTFVEYMIHKYLGHASQKTLKMFDRAGWLGAHIRAIAFSHTAIHHGSYGQNYVEQFAPKDIDQPDAEQKRLEKKARMDALILRTGEANANKIFDSDYGNRLATPLKDALMVMPFSMAFAIFTNFVAAHFGVHLGIPFDVAVAGSSVAFVPASYYMHSYLHRSKASGLEAAGPFMRWFLGTRYVAWIARSHYAHHDEGGENNQNLAAGADFVFGYQPLTVEQLLALRRYEAIY